MDTLFEANLGYVECNVCGSGYNTVAVYYDNYSPEDTPFRFVRNSRCYGNQDESGLTRDEVMARLDANKFFVATRYARRNWREFIRDLSRGKYDKGIRNPQRLRASLPETVAREDEGWGFTELPSSLQVRIMEPDSEPGPVLSPVSAYEMLDDNPTCDGPCCAPSFPADPIEDSPF